MRRPSVKIAGAMTQPPMPPGHTCSGVDCRRCRLGRRLFLGCLPLHAKLLGPLVILRHRRYFDPDWDLISSSCRAKSRAMLDAEIALFFRDPDNRIWLRRGASIRLSTRRLRKALQPGLS